MIVRHHPDFKSQYDRAGLRRLVVGGGLFVLLNIGSIYADRIFPTVRGSPDFDRFIMVSILAQFAIVLYVLIASWRLLYAARCPDCSSRLWVKRKHPEITDHYSGLCRQCEVLWDLQIDNSLTD